MHKNYKARQESPANFISSHCVLENGKMDICHGVLALEGVGWTDKRVFPLLIASMLIGSYEHGQLNSADPNFTSNFLRSSVSDMKNLTFQVFSISKKIILPFLIIHKCRLKPLLGCILILLRNLLFF